jgi:hypothetical protein
LKAITVITSHNLYNRGMSLEQIVGREAVTCYWGGSPSPSFFANNFLTKVLFFLSLSFFFFQIRFCSTMGCSGLGQSSPESELLDSPPRL